MNNPTDKLRATYDRTAAEYRKSDDLAVTGEDHKQICGVLRGICESFPHTIDVLSLGCGTGRDFSCLRNVRFLFGIDASEKMLEQAISPVNEKDAPMDRFLSHGDFNFYDPIPAAFDFIYCISTFGHGCELTIELALKIKRWLTPGGVFFFDVADSDGLPPCTKVRVRLRDWIYRRLPIVSQDYWNELTGSVPMWITSDKKILERLQQAGFKDIQITRRLSQMPCGEGWKLQVEARV